jgi:hypothetical protein
MALILKKHFLKMRYPFRKILSWPRSGHAHHFGHILSRHKKFKKIKKYTKPSRCVMLCDLDVRKNNKLVILQLFWKSVHIKEPSCTKFYGFQTKWASYGHNHGMVCSNDPILCTCVHLGMANNIDLRSFNFCCTKNPFFIFLVQQLGFFFVKHLSKIRYTNGPKKI